MACVVKGTMCMRFELTNLVGLLSMFGTVAGMVIAGALYEYNHLLTLLFAMLAIICFIIFVAYLYNFIMHARYILVEDPEGDDQNESIP